MPSKNSYITVTDQFCGAGGSSQGVRNVAQRNRGGLEVKLALNHWKLAIETHNTNFPDTLHDCTDISACDPRRYPSTDILITSPECTNHSVSNGKRKPSKQIDMFSKGGLDPAEERSRATMWDVPRFAEYHNYNIIIVENVVDARKWIMFESWLHAMHALGYNHKCVYLNSMHCWPTPQSRDRMYVVFWKKGNKTPDLEFMPLAYSPKLGRDVHAIQSWKNPLKKFGKYRQQYVYCCPETGDIVEPYYYAAFNAIDWSDLGIRIGDRKKPLSPNTTRRIQHGLDKYTHLPYVIHAAYSEHARGVVRDITQPVFTQTTFSSQAIVQPFVIKGEHTQRDGYVKKVLEAFQTQTVRQSMGIVIPLVVTNKGQSTSKPVLNELTTQTSQINHGICTPEALRNFMIAYNYNGNQVSHPGEPLDTVTTKDRMALINWDKPAIDDCYYRMLKPLEVKLSMGFDPDYVVLGSGKNQVKQCGNAVTPPAMEWLIDRAIQSLY